MAPDYTLHLGDCLDYMHTMADDSVDAVITDPPYGIALRTNYAQSQRGSRALCNDYPPLHGDDREFDPSPVLGFNCVVLFGANHYANKLPTNGAWHVWDKLDGLTSKRKVGFNDNSDCEFIWTNTGGAARIFRHRWMGAMKASEQNTRRVHPTQKPIVLMMQLIAHYTEKGDTVFDPFMGSGTTGVACMKTGRNFIGCEIDPDYFAIAQQRIEDAATQLHLFEEPTL